MKYHMLRIVQDKQENSVTIDEKQKKGIWVMDALGGLLRDP